MQWIKGKLNLLVPAAALAALPLLSGCDMLECGEGTFEVDGECVVDDGFDPSDPRCGDNTELVDGECVPIYPPAVCEGDFEIDENGVRHCVGGGGVGCATISCADPGGGNVISICGQLFDVETNEPIRVAEPTGAACDPGAPTEDGPCSLQVMFFDALGFAANPTGTSEQGFESKEINDCGHFKGIKVERPFSGQVAIGIEDATAVGGVPTDKRLLAGIANTFDMGERRADLRAFVFNKTTNTKWDDSAGNPFMSQTFFEKGAYAPVFCQPDCATGAPVEGVKVTRGGAVVAADDWYFDDTDPSTRSSVAPAGDQDATGVNGAALMVNSSLGTHSATGGDIGTCEWQSELAASVPSALFFRESFTHEPGNDEVLCDNP